MKNDNSQNKYRGFKYMMFALLFFVAMGLVFFSKGPFRAVDRQAEVKETAESMVASAQKQGKDLMAKANDMKEGLHGTMANKRDKMTEMASDLKEKVDQVAATATRTGTDWVEGANSVVSSTDDAMSRSDQSNTIADQTTKISDAMTGTVSEANGQTGTPSSVGSNQSEMIQKTSDAMTADVSQPKVAMDGSSSSLKPTMGSETVANKGDGSVSSGRCPVPPDMGQDLGNRYIVAFCETISIISERTGVGMNDLIDHNPQVENPNLIYPDQELRLPPRG